MKFGHEKKNFIGDCTGLNGKLIKEMNEKAKDITKKTFMKNCDVDDMMIGDVLNDRYTTFYKSFYGNKPCYFFEFSRIEHVFC